MVSVSISHSDFIFPPRDFFAQMYLYWPPHRISHFKFASQILHALRTSCGTNTQRGYKRSRPKARGTRILSSFQISTEVVSVTATKHVTGLEINTPPSPRGLGLVPGVGAGAPGRRGQAAGTSGEVGLGMPLEWLSGEPTLASLSASFLL